MNRFLILNNLRSDNPKFNRQRNVNGGKNNFEDENEVEYDEPKIIYEFQKVRLRKFNLEFYASRKLRQEKRTIVFEENIDFIKINFFKVFNTELKNIFFERYGILPIEYKDFNRTVIFEIVNRQSFEVYISHINDIIKSPVGVSYQNQPYNILAIIYEFSFIDSSSRIQTIYEKGILLNLVNSYTNSGSLQRKEIFNFLHKNDYQYTYADDVPDLIDIHNINKQDINFIADNFDIVYAITSSRLERIRPGLLGPIRDYTFEINVPENITTVGIIDTGIEKIESLKPAIVVENIDHTGNGAFWDEVGHGTLVSGLVILGDDFYANIKEHYEAKAKVFSIKVLQTDTDPIDIPRLINDIRYAKQNYGIRLFNMSLVIPFAKKYNDTFSKFAYELDLLSYTEDILVFISVGNFKAENLKALLEDYPHPDHQYPDFFYKLNRTTDAHSCEDTNICSPSESLNNISVGALAGNLEIGTDNSDVTPNMIYPAYYTRKFHYDYKQNINNSNIRIGNKYLNKPDFVFEGGDLFNEVAGIEILESPAPRGKYFARTCGTSLSTPLIASYAAEICNTYSSIRTQTVKAILINSASYYPKTSLPHFKTRPDSLLKSLVGFGKPQKEKILSTDEKSIVFIIEDEIAIGEIISRPIFLPKYLIDSGNKLEFDITLCYSFKPVKDNQLNYLPIHMSFNLTRNIDIKDIAEGVLKRSKDTPDKTPDYGIKNFGWSVDHFAIDNQLFSNAQSKKFRLQPNDYNTVGDSIAIAGRARAKNEFKDELKKQLHHFSLVIRVSELVREKNEFNLYNEMLAINNHLIIPTENLLDNNLEADIN